MKNKFYYLIKDFQLLNNVIKYIYYCIKLQNFILKRWKKQNISDQSIKKDALISISFYIWTKLRVSLGIKYMSFKKYKNKFWKYFQNHINIGSNVLMVAKKSNTIPFQIMFISTQFKQLYVIKPYQYWPKIPFCRLACNGAKTLLLMSLKRLLYTY